VVLTPGVQNYFKFCAVPLLQIICHLFHTSISFSTIPLDWRTHCVVTVYKAGDKSSVSNYRPISLLCILSKVLERIVYNNLNDYVRERSSKHQFGFLPNRSTLQKLLIMTFADKVLESKHEVDVVYMDFKKLLILCSTIIRLINYSHLEQPEKFGNGLKHIYSIAINRGLIFILM